MNYLNEEDYIKAINDNPENRAYQLLFAEYLQEKGEDNLAEGWRVLIEKGKTPVDWTHHEPEDYQGWNWDRFNPEGGNYPSFPLSANLYGLEFIPPLNLEDPIMQAFPTFFGAMQAAAVAYVRHTYDENYGKPVIHFIAYKTTIYEYGNWGYDPEEPKGALIPQSRLLYTNLGYDPEEQPVIIQAIIDGEPILVEIELEDGEAIGKMKARLRHFEALPNNLCNVELTTEKEYEKGVTG